MAARDSSSAVCALIADFTVSNLANHLAARADASPLECVVAPFDQVEATLLHDGAPLWARRPDMAVVWTRPERVAPAFARLCSGETVHVDEVLSEVDEFAAKLRAATGRVAAIFLPSWTMPAYDRGLGLLNYHPAHGPGYVLLRMNARMAEHAAACGNVYVLDTARWVAQVGPNATSPKLWHLGKIAFSPDVMRLASADIRAAWDALRGKSRKLLVLDLDDTLWGGIVGDVGWEGIVLGGHDPVGEAYVAFQRGLKALIRRGIVLGIVSKNTESIALEAIDRHPEMVLRRNDFVGWRINWEDKARNVEALASQLNLGLDSVVFIDDNPAERARVREALPDVFVPEWTTDKLLYASQLQSLTCFDKVAISEEDRARTSMYVSDRQRSELQHSTQSLDEYLGSLDLVVQCEPVESGNIARAAQLLNKTNQMNLTTRRMTEAQFLAWSREPGNTVVAFRVTDRFGEYGLTGLAGFTTDGSSATLVDFVLSCRVMGRGVERTMLATVIGMARELGLSRLLAVPRPTPRNAPCIDFFENQAGLERTADGTLCWSIASPYPLPRHVRLRIMGSSAPSVGAESPATGTVVGTPQS